MATPYLAEIKIFTMAYAPRGWALCNGTLLPINQNAALFSLVGTTYGGDGVRTFGLPNLQGRTPTHMGANGMTLGQTAGEQNHTLSSSEMPAHIHLVNASSANTGGSSDPAGRYLAGGTGVYYGGQNLNLTSLSPSEVASVGGSQPHNNMQPFLTLSFCIALQGIFPTRS